jgi:hypothetical protein
LNPPPLICEPFPSRNTQTDITFGRISRGHPLELVSQMADYGVIFSDGVEGDFLQFNSGMTAIIELADRSGALVV